jgi:retron EC67 protein
MSKLKELQKAKSLSDMANILGYKPSALSYLLYHLPNEQKYTAFSIPKRNGTLREILVPTPKLKLLQRRLANLLYQILADVNTCYSSSKALSHGFNKGLSIVTNANIHKRRRYVLNFDLKDFFPSINFGRVRGVFISDRRFALDPKIATLIAQIACYNNTLPQGSPCSPVISNIIGHLLDIRLVTFAKKYKCTYSRYADDITFSTNIKNFPSKVAIPKAGTIHEWELSNTLLKEIHKSGFTINPSKTRMQYRGSRQITTGLLVNEKPNVLPEYYRTVRSMCHSLFNTGSYYYCDSITLAKKPITSLNHLEGRLNYIYYIRKFNKEKNHSKEVTAAHKLYYKFLFYKNFIVPSKPIILTEGKTDSIYLKSAIEKLTTYHPKLGLKEGKIFHCSIKFMNFSRTVRDVLELGDGAGDLLKFITKYSNSFKTYKHLPLQNPVIIIIDNDDGAKEIISILKNKFKCDISLKTTHNFYRIFSNLYLIKTPESEGDGKSFIEQLFEPNLLEKEIDGKKFNPDKKHKEDGKYGKQVFAMQVVKKYKDTINFSKFSPLLDRIVSVIDFHGKDNL